MPIKPKMPTDGKQQERPGSERGRQDQGRSKNPASERGTDKGKTVVNPGTTIKK